MLFFWYVVATTVTVGSMFLALSLDDQYRAAWVAKSGSDVWLSLLPTDEGARLGRASRMRELRWAQIKLSAPIMLVIVSGGGSSLLAGCISIWLATVTVISGAFCIMTIVPKHRRCDVAPRHFMWQVLCWSAIAGLASPAVFLV